MKEQLSKETVMISGFGNFVVRSKNARRRRNPQTGVEMEISARKVSDIQVEPDTQEGAERADRYE
ncbi:MAG: HU family DNA-binding protein [Desulfobacterales bacterium]|nr:HU family DNA-binding protein [Desulfobacterales bacterium]